MGNDVLRAAGLVLELHQLDTTLMDKKTFHPQKCWLYLITTTAGCGEKSIKTHSNITST